MELCLGSWHNFNLPLSPQAYAFLGYKGVGQGIAPALDSMLSHVSQTQPHMGHNHMEMPRKCFLCQPTLNSPVKPFQRFSSLSVFLSCQLPFSCSKGLFSKGLST